jgi:hypothetical protein
MHHVYTLTAANQTTPHTIGVMPGPTPETTRPGDYMQFVHSFETEAGANNYRETLEHHYNIAGPMVVVCEQTGEIYKSGNEAARAVKGSQSAMANHLRGFAGFNSVKGFTFRRVPLSVANAMKGDQ